MNRRFVLSLAAAGAAVAGTARAQASGGRKSVKLLAIYEQPADPAAFSKHYNEVHLPLVRKIPGLQKLVLTDVKADVMGGAVPFVLMAEMSFADMASFDAAMKSSQGQAAAGDLAGFAAGRVRLLLSESGEV